MHTRLQPIHLPLLGLLVLLGAVACGASIEIVASQDSYVGMHGSGGGEPHGFDPNSNYGTQASLCIGVYMDGDLECIGQTYLLFDLSSLPENVTVNSAFVSIFKTQPGGTEEATVGIAHAAAAWEENTITWNNQPGAGLTITSGNVSGIGRKTFSLTSTVQQWRSTPSSNRGIVLFSPLSSIWIGSREASVDWQPKLVIDYSTSSTPTATPTPNPTPIANPEYMTNQPSAMYSSQQYAVASEYFDPDGRENLRYCYLRLDHPSGPDLTMMWNQDTGERAPWAGENGANYLVLDKVDVEETQRDYPGYRLVWHFRINCKWPETNGGIRFGVYAEDDDGGAAGWNYDDSDAAFSVPPFGTTIITHGYQIDGQLPSWPETMARAIRSRIGKAQGYLYKKDILDFSRLDWSDSDGERILVFDWAYESQQDQRGESEAAGDALFAALLKFERDTGLPLEPLHFIGHSRGCVVNSEAAERLLALGRMVDHVTTLDPHDNGFSVPAFTDDYDVNEPPLGSYDPQTGQVSGTYCGGNCTGVVTWRGISWADNYYQTDGLPEALLPGREVFGCYNVFLNERDDQAGVKVATVRAENPKIQVTITHSEVHQWYHGTIDISPETVNDGAGGQIDNNWYIGAGWLTRAEDGYNMSRVVGRQRIQDSAQGFLGYPQGPPYVGEAPSPQIELIHRGIVNGDFERFLVELNTTQIPGWEGFGGGGNGNVHNGHLELDWLNTSRTHNRFYVPVDASSIVFSMSVYESDSGTPPDVDRFEVLLDDTVRMTRYLNNQTDMHQEGISLFGSDRNKTHTLTFRICDQNGGTLLLNSEVWIDDVQFATEALTPTPTPTMTSTASPTATATSTAMPTETILLTTTATETKSPAPSQTDMPTMSVTPLVSPTPISLANALDVPDWSITDMGDFPWIGQSSISHDGADAAQSSVHENNKESTMIANITGPGTLRFWWKASCEATSNRDRLLFYLDSANSISINGETDWTQVTLSIPEGSHQLKWRYFKDGSGAAGQDTGWVDQIEFLPLSSQSPTPTATQIAIATPTATEAPTVTPFPGFTYLGEFGGSGYYLSTDAMHWEDAEVVCTSHGSHLVCLGSLAENEFLRDAVVSAAGQIGYWIGLSDTVSEGNFAWVTGEPLIFTSWGPNEPSNTGGIEDFVYEGGLGTWNDIYDTDYRFVMEIQYAAPTASPAPSFSPMASPTASTTPTNSLTASLSPSPSGLPTPLQPHGRPVLHVKLDQPSTIPGGGDVTYRYVWTSTGGDATVEHGPKTEIEDTLYEGDGGATFDAGEAWTVTVTPYNSEGQPGLAFSGRFVIESDGLKFTGWIAK